LFEHPLGWWPDRRYLTHQILPALRAARLPSIVFVGCRRYTRGYGRLFRDSASDFWTLDRDPRAAHWGEPGRHIVGDVMALDRLLATQVDAVLLNGVFGWGVDTPAAMVATLEASARATRPGGVLLLGWNQGRHADPLSLPQLAQWYRPQAMFGLPARRILRSVHTPHVYDLLERT
jgi:hypothetical protein